MQDVVNEELSGTTKRLTEILVLENSAKRQVLRQSWLQLRSSEIVGKLDNHKWIEGGTCGTVGNRWSQHTPNIAVLNTPPIVDRKVEANLSLRSSQSSQLEVPGAQEDSEGTEDVNQQDERSKDSDGNLLEIETIYMCKEPNIIVGNQNCVLLGLSS